ncbi:MAG TPA: M56 family metallopeptidase, partial [Flavobacterium alvei]|nr:M56 family metallopeptidase [Flavobacterium alvei]
IGIVGFLVKFALDFYSLSKVLKGKTIQHQADFQFIDVTENIAPFSYFNSIVYNSSLYSETELENILEHEKVHSTQNHTADVLISRLFCVVFWFNPLMWLYKKAIVQNLEFIADSEASKSISDKKAYQLTLLKVTTQENCVAITNHFYQSLIKKRIVMLNKNQSNKRNSWKYALVLPLLGAFLFFFQVKVIAQEKVSEQTVVENSKTVENSVDVYKINKNTTDAELKEKIKTLKEKYDVTLAFSGLERNAKNELTAIKVDLKKGKEITKKMATKGTEAIKTFGIIISKNENGKLTVDFGTDEGVINSKNSIASAKETLPIEKEIFIDGGKVSQEDLDKLDSNEIESMDVTKKADKGTIRIVTKKFSKTLNENDIYINDEKVDKNELLLLDQNTITKMDVNKNEKTIRITTKTIHQSADNIDIPTPPTPPVPPSFTFKTPKPPVFPKAPKSPKGSPTENKEMWKNYEKQINEYELQVKKMQLEAQNSDENMKAFEQKMKIYEEQMKVYEEQMKVYEEQMGEYGKKMEELYSKQKTNN